MTASMLYYMTKAADTLYEMRLIAEGAVSLLEDEAQTAMPRITNPDTAVVLDTLAAALYHLRGQIRQLQTEHNNEMLRLDEVSVSGDK